VPETTNAGADCREGEKSRARNFSQAGGASAWRENRACRQQARYPIELKYSPLNRFRLRKAYNESLIITPSQPSPSWYHAAISCCFHMQPDRFAPPCVRNRPVELRTSGCAFRQLSCPCSRSFRKIHMEAHQDRCGRICFWYVGSSHRAQPDLLPCECGGRLSIEGNARFRSRGDSKNA
jgi:hypothetical protein